jgi:hypothetical protein
LPVAQVVPVVAWKQEGLRSPASRAHSAWVTSLVPMKKGRASVTWCCTSSAARPVSAAGEPMTKVPAGRKFMPAGAQRSLAVPVGPMAQ